jgi:hypothetical protein
LLRNRLWPVKIVSCALFLAGTLSLAQTTTADQPVQKPATAKKTSSSKTAKPTSTSTHKTSTRRRRSRKTAVSSKKRGQQAIDPKRAQEIQEALIREHYLTGEPAGTWNDASQKAMQKYQADHGWQSKQVPDSRALIKLGLGPDHEHLLNPESAMTTQPEARHPAAPVSAPASTDNQ